MLYRPGSFFLTEISGPAGFAIGVGQALAGRPSRYEHAGIIVDLTGTTIEAEPGGARYGHIADYAGRAVLISDEPVQHWLAHGSPYDTADPPLAQWERELLDRRDTIVREARNLIDTPYSPLDYLALALLHLEQLLTGRKDSRWRLTAVVRRRVERSGHMICSQLVDAVYAQAGIHLFTDRLPGDVMPADLAAWAEDQQGGAA